MSHLPQTLVLCGGRGTRMAPVLGSQPKILAPIEDRPLLYWLLDDLARSGADRVLLLGGADGAPIAAAARALSPPGLRVDVHLEPRPAGTAGALVQVEHLLDDRFLVVLGDLFTAVDWHALTRRAEEDGGLATLLVHRTDHAADSDLVVLADDDRVLEWQARGPEREHEAVPRRPPIANAGAGVFDCAILETIPRDRPSDLFGEIVRQRVDNRAPIFGYRSSEYIRDIGTPSRLEAVATDRRLGCTQRRADLVLLDRDGVLVEDPGIGPAPRSLRLLPGAADAVAELNRAGCRVAVVTNQGGVARGLLTADELERLHDDLRRQLAARGATLDAIYVCPHHPETYHGEGHPELRGPCTCRKPSPGLVERALRELGARAWRTAVVGDRTCDLQLAANAGLPGIAVATGAGCHDAAYPARASWRTADLPAAARWLSGSTGDERVG